MRICDYCRWDRYVTTVEIKGLEARCSEVSTNDMCGECCRKLRQFLADLWVETQSKREPSSVVPSCVIAAKPSVNLPEGEIARLREELLAENENDRVLEQLQRTVDGSPW